MNIVVLGANGQLGSDISFVSRNLKKSHKLILLTREQLDITDFKAIDNVLTGINFDVLLNCTSYHKTDEGE